MSGRVWRLARDLPPFESVWVDALAQARILTPYQATEINAGRAARLSLGPYVLCRRLPSPGYAERFHARLPDRDATVELAVLSPSEDQAKRVSAELNRLVRCGIEIDDPHLAPLRASGQDAGRVWAMSEVVRGDTLAELVVRHGRLPGEIVLAVARQMVMALVTLRRHEIIHGDITLREVAWHRDGHGVLTMPGVRGVACPCETRTWQGLPPSAYDTMAPERIAHGCPPTWASDLYACGCLWWHLLAGRPPFAGGNRLTKLMAVQQAKLIDIRRFAPEAPTELLRAIDWCTQRDACRRPAGPDELAAMLEGRQSLSGGHHGDRAIAQISTLANRSWYPRIPRFNLGRRFKFPTMTQQSNFSPAAVRIMKPAVGRRGVNWPSGPTTAIAGAAALLILLTMTLWSRDAGAPLLSISPPRAEPSQASLEARPTRPLNHADKPARLRGDQMAAKPDPATTNAARWSGVAANGDAASGQAIELPVDGPLKLSRLVLSKGQTLRGRGLARPVVMVTGRGLLVDAEDVTFEGIDFIWHDGSESTSRPDDHTAMVRVVADGVRFRRCSFQVEPDTSQPVAAIRWDVTSSTDEQPFSLPTWQIEISNCVFAGTDVAIDCHGRGARRVTVAETLHQRGGPLLRLDRLPRIDEPVMLSLDHCTLREATSLLACQPAKITTRPIGTITIHSTNCVLAISSPGALFRLPGSPSWGPLAAAIRYSGQGSLLSPGAAVADWQTSSGSPENARQAIAVSGLVQSEVVFAGPLGHDPNQSRVVEWNVPLLSADPPGIDQFTFHLPAGAAANHKVDKSQTVPGKK